MMMPRRSLAMRPINSVKNIVDFTGLGEAAATTRTILLASVVNDYAGASGTIPIGAKLSSIYLFVQMINGDSSVANLDWYVQKAPFGVPKPTPGATGGDVARKYILHEEKGIPGNALDGAYPLTFKGVIRIPRGRQRMAEGDEVRFVYRSGGGTSNTCLKCIYKFYQ